MSKRAENKYILTKEQRAEYKRLLQDALEKAKAYDGTEAADQSLIAAFDAAETFVRCFTAGDLSLQAERAFADQAGMPKTDLGQAMVDGVQHFYDRLETKSADEMAADGLFVVNEEAVYVQTDDGEILPGNGDASQKFEIKTQPRLSWLIAELKDIGIYTDDLIIRKGKVDPHMMRQQPYVLVDIPRLNKQIALCDQVGEITFISDEILDPRQYQYMSKDQLKALPGLHTVICQNREQWLAGITAHLQAGRPANDNKVNVRAHEAKPRTKKIIMTEEMIVAVIKAYYAEHGKWPTLVSDEIIQTSPLQGKKWSAVNAALRQGSNGLSGGSSLADLKKRNGFGVWTEEMIVDAINAYHAEHNKWPTLVSDEIIQTSPLQGKKWSAVDAALRQGSNGLPGGSSLADLKKSYGLGVWTEEMIVDAINAYHAEHNKWPTLESDEIIQTSPLQGKKWSAVNAALRQGCNGLPGGSSLPDLRERYGLVDSEWTEEMIVEAIKAYYDEHGKWPSKSSGEITQPGPLQGKTWDAVDTALRQGCNGLPGVSSLADLKKRNGFGVWTEEMIVDAIEDYYAERGEWPMANKEKITHPGLLDGKTWSAVSVALNKGRNGLEGGSSLIDLRQRYGLVDSEWTEEMIVEAIKAYYAEHGKWPTLESDEIIQTSPLQGKKWSAVDSALRQGSNGLSGGSSLVKLKKQIKAEMQAAAGDNPAPPPSPA